jgi:hypothetical protein
MLRIGTLALATVLFAVPATAQNSKSGTAPGQSGVTPGQTQTTPGGAKDLAPGRLQGDAKDVNPGSTRRDSNPGSNKKK